MAAATVASNRSSEPMYISRATIQLRPPQSEAPPRVYEWRTQVTTLPKAVEAPVECIKHNGSSAAAPAPAPAPPPPTKRAPPAKVAKTTTPLYTPPRIRGDEAKRKNLLQTLDNFYDVERYNSAWNRVTKRDEAGGGTSA